jgi:putative hydrolase of the HAD superfamily
VRAVCFDLGGTIVPITAGPTTGQVARLLGVPLPAERTLMEADAKRRRVAPEDLSAAICAHFARPDLLPAVTGVLQQARDQASHPALFPDVQPVLAALLARGFRLLALSNVLGCSVPATHPPVFRDWFTAVLYSADLGVVKPEREAFRHAERAAGLNAHQLLHVGDSLRADVAGAAQAGWHTAWLDRRGDHTVQAPPVPRIQSLTELLDLLPARVHPAAAT